MIGQAEEDAALRAVKRAREESSEFGAFDRYGGIEVSAYEKEFAAYIGVADAAAVSSGTAALHAAFAALEIEPGAEVICPPISDVGGVAPILMQLCIPVFADSRAESYNVSPQGIRAVLSPRTRAIVVAHIAGEPCEMDAILEIARENNIPVIEDVAQAHGATWKGHRCGSMGAGGAFSMMGGKHHTSGGQGGMVTSSDPDFLRRARAFADRGKMFYPTGIVNEVAGLNYRMTELEAAIGRAQLEKLPSIVSRRQTLAKRLAGHLENSNLFRLGWTPQGGESSFWFLRIRILGEQTENFKNEITNAMNARGIPSAPTYTSMIYHQKWFKDRRVFPRSRIPWSLCPHNQNRTYEGCCPNAEAAMRNHIRITLNESMSVDLIDRVAEAMLEIENQFSGAGC